MDVVTPPNTLPEIRELWAYLSVDAAGNEGLCASILPGIGMTPLLAADPERLKALKPIAAAVARESGMRIRLVKFIGREVLETIDGGH